MKKLIALILALVMVLALTACGSSTASDTNTDPVADTAEAAPADTADESAEEPAEAPADETADSDLAYVQDKGVLIVGITEFEPMDYKDENGEWIGFDADLGKAFAESLGVDIEFVEIDWDGKILELDSGAIDCIWNGMTLTPEVTSAASCSNPYMMNAQVVVLPADVAENYADVESLADLTFAVEAGSAGEAAVSDLGYATTPVSTQADALMEVAAGTSDAAVIDLLMAYAMTGDGTGYADLTYTVSLNAEEYGVAFRQGSDLTDAFNEFLSAAYADGTSDALAETYGLSGSVIAQ